jgi:uncharacterized protein DUF6636
MLPTSYDPAMRRFAAILLVSLAVAPAARARTVVVGFRTPSGNIGCMFGSGFGGAPSLRCDIRSGLKPLPPRPKGCDLDWGDSFELRTTGRASVTCHGDTAIDPRSRVLRYGSTWKRAGFKCTSRMVGLRCRNRSGHGFFLSRGHSYRF